jgi:hypothetical protein
MPADRLCDPRGVSVERGLPRLSSGQQHIANETARRLALPEPEAKREEHRKQ